MSPTTVIHRFAPFAAILQMVSLSANAGDIAVFDFEEAWQGAKEPNFKTFAENAPSVDEHAGSVVSALTNNGLTSGGFASFVLNDAFANTTIFSTSDTPGTGMNFGGANQAEATNYFSFMVTPEDGISVSYGSLTLFTSAFGGSDTYNVELRAVVGDGEEEVMGDIHEHTAGGANNEPVHAVTFDFDDFMSSSVTEWRVYVYNTDNAAWAIRFDDVTLKEPATPIVPPAIIDFSIVDGILSLTWESSPTGFYSVRYSTDLQNWDGDLDDGVSGDEGGRTTRSFDLVENNLGDFTRLFVRVEEE